jgi:pimeloyl-ACP methyl ester carboxylesterase
MDEPQTPNESVRSSDGTTIAFDRYGDGRPLIVVLGAFCDRATPRTLAELLAADLAADLSVYTYDRRGRGGSGDTPPYSVDREIDDLDAMIRRAGGSPFVYGHSSGAVLGLEAAARGLPIGKLAVYEPPYIVEDTRVRPDKLGERVGALVASGRRSDAVKLFLTEGPEVPPDVLAAMEAGPGWSDLEAMAHTLPYDLAICGDQFVPTDLLANIRVPTLALSGGASPAWAGNAVDAVAEAIPGAHRVVLEGQTHGVADDVLGPVLARFFEG